VYATADGRVNYAGRYSARQSVAWWRYGNLVSIKNGDGFIALYGHLDTVLVKEGQRVKLGEQIGTVGNSGWSTNPHLHYEVRKQVEDGEHRPVDPRIYILDHRWRDEEKLLVRARSAPSMQNFEPLPRRIAR
jgi:murein DD-endopeptidase MepM/ murein hydrolase activator NlpD